MKSLSAPLTTEAAQSQSGWAEVIDIYLRSSITTPVGSTATLRLCTVPGNISFFTPVTEPEPSGTQGDAATYYFWPMQREPIRNKAKHTNDRTTISFSNVTAEWAGMLRDVEWRDCSIVIRKVPLSASGVAINPASLTSADCVILFVGLVDSAIITEEAIQFSFSSDLSQFNLILPRENMHGYCRFQWADDQCTKIRFHSEHYISKTAGANCTTSIIKSSGLTEDDGPPPYRGVAVTAAAAPNYITLTAHGLQPNQRVMFTAAVMPTNLVAGQWYYVNEYDADHIQLAATRDGAVIDFTSDGTSVLLTSEAPYGTDLVNGISDAAITSSSERSGFENHRVKHSYTSDYWKVQDDTDWGTLANSIYQIGDLQAGLTNPILKPWIQFDFGSAKNVNGWRFAGVADASRDRMVRLLQIFSDTASDMSSATFEGYFELPPRQGDLIDWFRSGLATAQTARRYWRVCIRSRWNETFYPHMLRKVYAFEDCGRHYWRAGRVTFASNTTTVALRNVSRRVLESYAGEVVCEPLPTAPASGDTFVIERGCPRFFNDCARRMNTENYGGFDPLAIAQLAR